ncbi:lysophosphatidic acid receptor 4 [Conger conger]|uniref:lysophosphatidic acid receptor 4 n=1 Tax=Conger conger TaxID=82655 RepID=UPI002A5A40B3|nr:lysophosphatidic acid receptor 4 [Conger conger]
MMNNSTADCNLRADFQIYLFPAVYCLVFVLGLLGNVGALYVFIFKITPRSSSNVFVINLALADTIFLCTLPFLIHYHLNGNNWIFGSPACLVIGTLFYTNIYISVAFLTCICIDRYIATVYPLTYLRLRATRCTLWVSLAVWMVTGAAMLALVFTGPLDSVRPPKNGSHRCYESFSQREWASRMTAYNVSGLVFGSVLPLAIIMVCYPLVARRLAHIRTRTSRRALRIIYSILAITTICFVPYAVVHLLHLLMRHQVIQDCVYANIIYKARRLTMALVSLNSCLDPVLYYFTTSHCKWSFFKRLRLRRTQNVYTINKRN